MQSFKYLIEKLCHLKKIEEFDNYSKYFWNKYYFFKKYFLKLIQTYIYALQTHKPNMSIFQKLKINKIIFSFFY